MCDLFGDRGRIDVTIHLPPDFVEHDRQLKKKYEDIAQPMIDSCTLKTPSDLPEVIVQLKRGIFDYYWGTTAQNKIQEQKASSILDEQRKAFNTETRLKRLWNRLKKIGIDPATSKAQDFMLSEELFNIPFVDIFAGIDGARVTHYPNKPIRGGDMYDNAILSSVLPYCDVVTTDSFQKHILLNILHYDEKYKCKVYSPSLEDVIAFHEFVTSR